MSILTAIKQGTPEWHSARRGLATGSAWGKAMQSDATRKADAFGKGAMDYALEIAAERMGGEDENIETHAMVRGSSLEEEAIDTYENAMFNTVQRGSFYVHDTLACGASPDGVIVEGGKVGIVEVKCMKLSKHAACWVDQMPPQEHYAQMQFNMWLIGAEFCDFVSYHPTVKADMRLCVLQVQRDSAYITQIALRAVKFLEKVDQYARALGVADWVPFHVAHPHLALLTPSEATKQAQ